MAIKRASYRFAVIACLVAGVACFCQAQSRPAAWPVAGNTRPFIRPVSATGAAEESKPIALESLLDTTQPAPPTPATRPTEVVVVKKPVAVATLPASQPASAPVTRPAETLPDTVLPAPTVAAKPAMAVPASAPRAEAPPAKPAVEISDDLAAALREKPEVPITLPRGFKEPIVPLNLPRDGSMLVDHRARLIDIGEGWRALAFERAPSRPQEATRYVLPSQLLEQMEQALAKEPNTLFRVSGENTTYKKVSYIMLTKAIVEVPRSPAPKSQPAEPPTPVAASAHVAVASAPASMPASASASGPASRAASEPASREVNPNATTSDDILAKMLDERPGTPLIIAAQRPLKAATAPSGAPVPTGDPDADRTLATPQQKWLVIDRLARILKDENSPWMQVHFEADNTLDDEPLRLLPATILEKAELSNKIGIPVRVSGIISQYQGRRYLLLRKVSLERDMGQF